MKSDLDLNYQSSLFGAEHARKQIDAIDQQLSSGQLKPDQAQQLQAQRMELSKRENDLVSMNQRIQQERIKRAQSEALMSPEVWAAIQEEQAKDNLS